MKWISIIFSGTMFLANLFLNIFINIFSNKENNMTWYFIGAILFGLIAFVAYRISVKPVRYTARINAPIPMRNTTERRDNARKGLIFFIPKYNPIKSKDAQALSEADKQTAMEQKNYTILDLKKSNLEPAIEAVTSHKGILEHCWFISTAGTGGSHFVIETLISYLKNEEKVNCQFHYDDHYFVSFTGNDTTIVNNTKRIVDKIYAEAKEKFGLDEHDMIADITSGPRSMPLGMILACLDKSRDIEYIGTDYNEHGQPILPLTPIILEFETEKNQS